MPKEMKDDPRVAATPYGVLCFANNLFKARPASEGGKPRWSCIMLFDSVGVKSEAYQNLRAAVAAAIADKWGAQKAADPTFVRTLRLPFRNASEKAYEGFEDGEIFISPWKDGEQEPPEVVDRQKLPLTQAQVWSGQMARCTVRSFAYDNSGNKGVGFGLEYVQVVKQDMPRIDGRRTASQAFKDVDDAELVALGITPDAPAGTKSVSDDMPF